MDEQGTVVEYRVTLRGAILAEGCTAARMQEIREAWAARGIAVSVEQRTRQTLLTGWAPYYH